MNQKGRVAAKVRTANDAVIRTIKTALDQKSRGGHVDRLIGQLPATRSACKAGFNAAAKFIGLHREAPNFLSSVGKNPRPPSSLSLQIRCRMWHAILADDRFQLQATFDGLQLLVQSCARPRLMTASNLL